MVLFCRNFSFPFRPNSNVFLDFLTSDSQPLKYWNVTNGCHLCTDFWPTFLHPKWEEPPPQISPGCQCIAIKRTELSRALWKAVGLELSGIKTPTAECVSGSHLLCCLCTRPCCGSCPRVVCLEWMEGTNSSDNVSRCYFFISCISPHRLFVPLTIMTLWIRSLVNWHLALNFPLKILPN